VTEPSFIIIYLFLIIHIIANKIVNRNRIDFPASSEILEQLTLYLATVQAVPAPVSTKAEEISKIKAGGSSWVDSPHREVKYHPGNERPPTEPYVQVSPHTALPPDLHLTF